MLKRIIISIALIVLFVILGFITTNKIDATVTYTDKSFDRYGRVLFWVQTEGSSYLRQVNYPAKVGDSVALYGLSTYSIVFFILASLTGSYIVYIIVKDADL